MEQINKLQGRIAAINYLKRFSKFEWVQQLGLLAAYDTDKKRYYDITGDLVYVRNYE